MTISTSVNCSSPVSFSTTVPVGFNNRTIEAMPKSMGGFRGYTWSQMLQPWMNLFQRIFGVTSSSPTFSPAPRDISEPCLVLKNAYNVHIQNFLPANETSLRGILDQLFRDANITAISKDKSSVNGITVFLEKEHHPTIHLPFLNDVVYLPPIIGMELLPDSIRFRRGQAPTVKMRDIYNNNWGNSEWTEIKRTSFGVYRTLGPEMRKFTASYIESYCDKSVDISQPTLIQRIYNSVLGVTVPICSSYINRGGQNIISCSQSFSFERMLESIVEDITFRTESHKREIQTYTKAFLEVLFKGAKISDMKWDNTIITITLDEEYENHAFKNVVSLPKVVTMQVLASGIIFRDQRPIERISCEGPCEDVHREYKTEWIELVGFDSYPYIFTLVTDKYVSLIE